jgi:hypothetical protein
MGADFDRFGEQEGKEYVQEREKEMEGELAELRELFELFGGSA